MFFRYLYHPPTTTTNLFCYFVKDEIYLQVHMYKYVDDAIYHVHTNMTQHTVKQNAILLEWLHINCVTHEINQSIYQEILNEIKSKNKIT